jgi:cold shock CspA family protein
MAEAIDSSSHLFRLKAANQFDREAGAIVALRAAVKGVRSYLDVAAHENAAELLEVAVELTESIDVGSFSGESLDRLAQLRALSDALIGEAEGYPATKAKEYRALLTESQRRASPESVSRQIGTLKTLRSDKGFGFVKAGSHDYFFHYRDLVNAQDWDRLATGVSCGFDPVPSSPKGPRAERVRLLE